MFTADPGPTVLRWGWFLWLSWAIVGTGLLGEDRGSGFAMSLVLSAPFWALWVLWPVYRGWALLARRGQRATEQGWRVGTGGAEPGHSTQDQERDRPGRGDDGA